MINRTPGLRNPRLPTLVRGVAEWETFLRGVTPGGRLTLTTALPVTTADVTAAATIYYTPYTHNILPLLVGGKWRPHTFDEISLSLSNVAVDTNYDIFAGPAGGGNSAKLYRGVGWSSATARGAAAAITLYDGVYVRSVDRSQRLLGTIRGSGSGTTEDSASKRFVWNSYNRVLRRLLMATSDSAHTYNSATFRYFNNDSTHAIYIVCGLAVSLIDVTVIVGTEAASGARYNPGIGVDSSTVDSSQSRSYASTVDAGYVQGPLIASLRQYPAIGYHEYAWLESAGNGTPYGLGTNGEFKAAITAMWEA